MVGHAYKLPIISCIRSQCQHSSHLCLPRWLPSCLSLEAIWFWQECQPTVLPRNKNNAAVLGPPPVHTPGKLLSVMLHSFLNTGIVFGKSQTKCTVKHWMNNNDTRSIYFCAGQFQLDFLFFKDHFAKSGLGFKTRFTLSQIERSLWTKQGLCVVGDHRWGWKGSVFQTKWGTKRKMRAAEFYRAELSSQGTGIFTPDIDTITHREKAYQMIVTQVLYKQIFRQAVGASCYLSFLPLPATWSFVRFNTALQGHWKQTKEKNVWEGKRGEAENNLLSQPLLKDKSAQCVKIIYSLSSSANMFDTSLLRAYRKTVLTFLFT